MTPKGTPSGPARDTRGPEPATLLAVAVLGLIVFVAELLAVRDGSLAPGDTTAFRVVRHLHSDAGVHIAQVLTWLGAAPVAWTAIVAVALLLARREQRPEAIVLVAGLIVTVVVVHITKVSVDRPRPPRPLTTTLDPSFPSGHTANATGLFAAAVIAARAALVGRRGALAAAGFAVMVVVGFTRVYLRAHYFSDVVAGAGLSLALFALCAIVALVVDRVRHNGTR